MQNFFNRETYSKTDTSLADNNYGTLALSGVCSAALPDEGKDSSIHNEFLVRAVFSGDVTGSTASEYTVFLRKKTIVLDFCRFCST